MSRYKGKLVKKYGEYFNGEDYRKALGTDQCGSGIYALYDKKGNVYYIGISTTSMRGRIRKHLRIDRHKGKWERFSFYQIKRIKLLKDIESILLRIYEKPKGNAIKGKFVPKYNLAKKH